MSRAPTGPEFSEAVSAKKRRDEFAAWRGALLVGRAPSLSSRCHHPARADHWCTLHRPLVHAARDHATLRPMACCEPNAHQTSLAENCDAAHRVLQ